MLRSLTVSNFALVDHLDIQLGRGLTVITGESGAGKSILLAALSLILGERAATEAIRPGSERAEVSAEFDLSDVTEAREYLAGMAMEDPDQPERALVRRIVNRDGRSRAFLNGTPVNLSVLRELTGGLVDIHGQDDNQRLSTPEVQRALLDGYAVPEELLTACRKAFHAWRSAIGEHERLKADAASREDRATLLTYQLEELSAVAPEPGEFEEVEQTHKRLSQAAHLQAVVADALDTLEGADLHGQVRTGLARLDDDHPDLESARQTLLTISDLTTDAVRDLRSFQDSLTIDQEDLETLSERLETLHELARKHRVAPQELPELVTRLSEELEAIDTDRGNIEALAEEAARQEAAYRELAARLTSLRREAADAFCAAVSEHMNTLGIKGGGLALEFIPRESEFGAEAVEFLCVTNPRYPAAPLKQIASGGERARISLSIQIVAAARTQLPCLILDEADVGVGGTTADVVGRLLRKLAAHTQVICVTHAPQIAALGDAHLKVHKDTEQDTRITALDAEERVDELARMLAGSRIGDKSRDYARTLLEEATG